jgi:hypothetical protein
MSLIAEKSSDSILPKKFDLVENLKKKCDRVSPLFLFSSAPSAPSAVKKKINKISSEFHYN